MKKEKNMTENTVAAYHRDIMEFEKFLGRRGINALQNIRNADVVAYLMELKQQKKSAATINRKMASLRSFFGYHIAKGRISSDPTTGIKAPKTERKEICYLTIQEMDRVLAMPDETLKGRRDKAILEVLYATGIRVSESIALKVADVNLRMGFISCTSTHSKARIIPLGRPARSALEQYIYDVRPELEKGKGADELFLNYRGVKLTRQGLWKLIKQYAKEAGIETEITPQIFRNSFAVHMIQNGADLKSLQNLLGHEDITATQIYLSVTKNRIKEVYDKTHPRA